MTSTTREAGTSGEAVWAASRPPAGDVDISVAKIDYAVDSDRQLAGSWQAA